MHRTSKSRADLLRCLGQGISPDAAAEVLNFRRKETTPAPKPEFPAVPTAPQTTETRTPQEALRIEFPSERPRLQFIVPTEAEALTPEPPRRDIGQPISDAALAVDWRKTGPALPPLTRWARLAPFLRHRLGHVVEGAQLDERKLMRLAGRGLPLLTLPRRLRETWASQVLVLWDCTEEMYPFTRDVRWLLHQLSRERGAHGLMIRVVRRWPSVHDFDDIPRHTPVVALSAMGQLVGSENTSKAWSVLGEKLSLRGHPIHALMPCPRDSWHADPASVWPSAVWDRRPLLPRRGGLRPLSAPSSGSTLVEGEVTRPPLGPDEAALRDAGLLTSPSTVDRLLTLLSPASRIESPLLRTARLRLGPQANVGTEWQAWNDADGWASPDACGFIPGGGYEKRLADRRALTGDEAVLAKEIGALMAAHHENCSVVIAAEARLRACLTGGSDPTSIQEVKLLLKQVVDRLRLIAPEPGNAAGKGSGLAPWFVGMVDRLDAGMRSNPALAELITDGLAFAHSFLETTHLILPKGIDAEAFGQATRGVVRQSQPRDYRIELRSRGEWLAGLELVRGQGLGNVTNPPLELLRGTLRAASAPVHFNHSGTAQRFQLAPSVSKCGLASLSRADAFSLVSDQQKLQFKLMKRPAWARRMWYDRYGLAAEFVIGKVPFVLRWIPPGRFTMGSPVDEPGRYPDEGPQHEVTISQGFWLGETPVTQAQWRVVVGLLRDDITLMKKLPSRELKVNPNKFRGPLDLPVESVNWLECRDFCGLLNALMQAPDLQFHLPSEAQWEYACRAGTETAFNDGSACTEPEGHDPALERLGWFDKNSGGKTHVVKEKNAPNVWGLHDMHGNVWEWCADEWDEKVYAKRADGVTDPLLDSASDSDLRVFRGGSWLDRARVCRSAVRFGLEPGFRSQALGLRLAAGQELGGGAAGRGAPSAGEAEPSPEGRRQSRAAGEIFSKKAKR
jgi:formylglycine-generating enzyme required for sulfatase activity